MSITNFGRRQAMKLMGAAAGAAALPVLSVPAHAQARATRETPQVITRTVPRTNEVLPAIGLGTFLVWDVLPGQPRDHLREVLQRFWEGGGRVVDTSPLYGSGEVSLGDFAAALGINDQLFVANKIWSTGQFLGDPSHAAQSLQQSKLRLWRDKLDVMQCHSLVNVDIVLPLLKVWKKEGQVRYVGITHHDPEYFDSLATWLQKEDLDFVQVRYSIFERRAEERILPLAADKGTAVLVNMPLEKGRLHKIVEGRPLPPFAKELGIETWSQYFLKWVISHPAVTCAVPGTSNPAHAAENIRAMHGPLPDREMRARMLRHMETIPGFSTIEKMAWYPEKTYPGLIGRARRELLARS